MKRNGFISSYLVIYTVDEDQLEERLIDLEFTAAGLQPHTSYNFTVTGFVGSITTPSPPARATASTIIPQGNLILSRLSCHKQCYSIVDENRHQSH